MNFLSSKLTAEENKILLGWNNTYADYPHHKILPELFEEVAEKNPNKVVLLYRNQILTYQQLNTKANQLAHLLRTLGVGNQKLVAICLEPSFELIIALLAVLKSGGAYVPLDPNNPTERQRLILEDTQATVLISSSQYKNLLNEINTQTLYLDQDKNRIETQPITNLSYLNYPHSLAYVIYTSGSTGKPKGVMISHRNVNHFTEWFANALKVSSEDIFDFSSSISFDFSVVMTLFPILVGAKIAICPEESKKDPYLYLQHLLENQVTIIKKTPSHFRQFKELVFNEKINLAFRYIIFGGEALFVNDIKDWINCFPNQIMFCEYGPTETTVATSWIKVDKQNIHDFTFRIPIGRPAANTQLYILNKEREPVSIGELGELYVGGDGVAVGYLNRPTVTDKAFVDNPFHTQSKLYKTGDICRYLKDGNIEFIERIDNQIKINGFRVEIDEIENALLTHPDIQHAVIIVREIGSGNTTEKQLIAYFVPKSNQIIDVQLLRQYLQTRLPTYMIPLFFVSLDELPLSDIGKVDRNKLPLPEIRVNTVNEIPQNEIEATLKTIWLETLNLNQVQVEDNFFELGGHSLAAARIITKIKQKYNKIIKLQDFYQSPTIKGLIQILDQTDAINATDFLQQTIAQDSHSTQVPLHQLQFLFWLMRLFYPTSRVPNVIRRKRMCGKMNATQLNNAFAELCRKHPTLCYHIPQYYPVQIPQKINSLIVDVIDLSHFSHEQQENILMDAFKRLEAISWKKNRPLIAVKLFYLTPDCYEIQIALSHFISDEISMDIAFADLSQSYLSGENTIPIVVKDYYKEYILQEADLNNTDLLAKMSYWENHLHDSELLRFPESVILSDINSGCTTYFEIPECTFQQLKTFCTSHRLTLADSICATIAFTLKKYLNSKSHTLVLNLVKSTRENDIYDKTIGLFVRSDLIKVDFAKTNSFIELAQQIQNTIVTSAPYQLCPTIVKLGCLLKNNIKNKKYAKFLSSVFTKGFTLLFPKAKLNKLVLKMFGQLFVAKRKNQFFIDINIMNNFMYPKKEKTLFDSRLQQVPSYKPEKIISADVVNIWFERDDNHTPYLVISGKLTADFRNRLGQSMLDIITEEMNPS